MSGNGMNSAPIGHPPFLSGISLRNPSIGMPPLCRKPESNRDAGCFGDLEWDECGLGWLFPMMVIGMIGIPISGAWCFGIHKTWLVRNGGTPPRVII